MNDQTQTKPDTPTLVTPVADPKKDPPNDASKLRDQPQKPPVFDKPKEQQAPK